MMVMIGLPLLSQVDMARREEVTAERIEPVFRFPQIVSLALLVVRRLDARDGFLVEAFLRIVNGRVIAAQKAISPSSEMDKA